jgi:hypothetical protein
MNLRRYITYPHVVSSLALFIALGGSAYAVTQIDPNSVGTKQLKANAVKSGKIKDGTIKRVDAKAGAFATPPQLAGKLGIGATAANSAKLGNIGPNGFLKGNGSTLLADYDVNVDDVPLTFPGGQIALQCGTTGYDAYFLATSGSWDLYQFRYRDDEAQPDVTHLTREPSDVFVLTFTKQESVLEIDARSSAGHAVSLTVFARFDDATDRCIGRIRGMTYPNG